MKVYYNEDFNFNSSRGGNEGNSKSPCQTSICELLNNLSKHSTHDFGIGLEGHKQSLLILNKDTSEPISVDGMDPTMFTLEDFDSERCLAVFSFNKEELDSSTGITNVRGIFVVDCRNIGGIFFLK